MNDNDYDRLIAALETLKPCPITGTLTDQIKLAPFHLFESDLAETTRPCLDMSPSARMGQAWKQARADSFDIDEGKTINLDTACGYPFAGFVYRF
jgi:hypothetical protein